MIHIIKALCDNLSFALFESKNIIYILIRIFF